MRILLVEDDEPLSTALSSSLRGANYVVDCVYRGKEALAMLTAEQTDIVILDLGLPDMDGLEVLRQIRQKVKDMPVIILTARDQVSDRIEGLNAGADDYLVKPFHFEELIARINALSRRASGWSNPTLSCGPITLNPATQEVTKNGQLIELTAYEYRLLHYLLLHTGEVISKTELTDHIYEQDQDRDSNVIEVFVKRLRSKLDPDKQLNPIETLRGRGYRLNLPRESH